MTIWKYETSFDGQFIIKMPKDAEILCVQRDEKTSIPCIWALVNPENEEELRHFELYGTGHSIPNVGVNRNYIGTYQYQKGEFVGHLFEIR